MGGAGGAFELLAANGDALAALAAAVDAADALCAALACRALRDALWHRFPQHPPWHPQARTAAGGGAVLARPLVYFCCALKVKFTGLTKNSQVDPAVCL